MAQPIMNAKRMAASTMSIIPLIALFFFAQKQIIQSYARSGLKE